MIIQWVKRNRGKKREGKHKIKNEEEENQEEVFSKIIEKIKAGRRKVEGEEENKGKEQEEGEQDYWEK